MICLAHLPVNDGKGGADMVKVDAAADFPEAVKALTLNMSLKGPAFFGQITHLPMWGWIQSPPVPSPRTQCGSRFRR